MVLSNEISINLLRQLLGMFPSNCFFLTFLQEKNKSSVALETKFYKDHVK